MCFLAFADVTPGRIGDFACCFRLAWFSLVMSTQRSRKAPTSLTGGSYMSAYGNQGQGEG
jgi:hypothetical protein